MLCLPWWLVLLAVVGGLVLLAIQITLILILAFQLQDFLHLRAFQPPPEQPHAN